MKKKLIAFYLDYLNNWLKVANMASHYDITETDCQLLIDMGRVYHTESTQGS